MNIAVLCCLKCSSNELSFETVQKTCGDIGSIDAPCCILFQGTFVLDCIFSISSPRSGAALIEDTNQIVRPPFAVQLRCSPPGLLDEALSSASGGANWGPSVGETGGGARSGQRGAPGARGSNSWASAASYPPASLNAASSSKYRLSQSREYTWQSQPLHLTVLFSLCSYNEGVLRNALMP